METLYCPNGYILSCSYLPGKKSYSKYSLSKHGYSSKKSKKERHKALIKANISYGNYNLISKLNYISLMNKNKNPVVSAIFRDDKIWVMNNLMIN